MVYTPHMGLCTRLETSGGKKVKPVCVFICHMAKWVPIGKIKNPTDPGDYKEVWLLNAGGAAEMNLAVAMVCSL